MPVTLIHPPLNGIPSGGNVFNSRILQQARKQGFEMRSLALCGGVGVGDALNGGPEGLWVWDSLFFPQLAECAPRLAETKSGLLCHYLPSTNPDLDEGRRRSWEDIERRALKAMRFTVVAGDRAAAEVRRLRPELPAYVCEPGVDEAFKRGERKRKSATGEVGLLTVANLLPEKGYMGLVDVLAGLGHLPWRWAIAGSCKVDPGFADSFRKRAGEAGILSRIDFQGDQDSARVADLMREADVFIYASRYETYGMVLAEAAACGLPVVSTAVGAAARLIENGRNGFVVPAGNLRVFSATLKRILIDADLRSSLSCCDLNRTRSWRECFDDFKAICLTELNEQSGNRRR
ncbi:MAG: glycosyltransferase family 4 protein [Gammaproteobacteria bacterium]